MCWFWPLDWFLEWWKKLKSQKIEFLNTEYFFPTFFRCLIFFSTFFRCLRVCTFKKYRCHTQAFFLFLTPFWHTVRNLLPQPFAAFFRNILPTITFFRFDQSLRSCMKINFRKILRNIRKEEVFPRIHTYVSLGMSA